MKFPVIILLILGLASFVFGIHDLKEQIYFERVAQEVRGTVLSISGGSRRSNGSPKVMASYVLDGVTRVDRLHLPLFANGAEFTEGKEVTLKVAPVALIAPQIRQKSIDILFYYVSGIFFTLIGLMFAMFGMLIQRFGKM